MGAIKIKGETSGSTTIVAPATGSDVTMTLPGSSLDLGAELASKLPIAGGKILQVLRATDTTNRATTSISLVDVTGMSVTITPQKNDSIVLIIATCYGNTAWSTGDDGVGIFTITDNSNNAISGAEVMPWGTAGLTGTGSRQTFAAVNLLARDAPGSTNAKTYKLRFRSSSSNTTSSALNASSTGQMYAIEVSA
jgi:hypothetical protein